MVVHVNELLQKVHHSDRDLPPPARILYVDKTPRLTFPSGTTKREAKETIAKNEEILAKVEPILDLPTKRGRSRSRSIKQEPKSRDSSTHSVATTALAPTVAMQRAIEGRNRHKRSIKRAKGDK